MQSTAGIITTTYASIVFPPDARDELTFLGFGFAYLPTTIKQQLHEMMPIGAQTCGAGTQTAGTPAVAHFPLPFLPFPLPFPTLSGLSGHSKAKWPGFWQ
jgi:hypothetical protein